LLFVVSILVDIHKHARFLRTVGIEGEPIDQVSGLVVPEGVDELQVPVAIEEFLCFAERSDDLVAERCSDCRVFHHAFRHLAIRIANDVDDLTVEAGVDYLPRFNLVPVAVKFTFPASDWHYHCGTTGLLPMNTGWRGNCGNGFDWSGKSYLFCLALF
jgi:hypothetical protein